MAKDWGKVYIATRYQPNLPALSCESLIDLVKHGARNAPADLIAYVAALEQVIDQCGLQRPPIDRPLRYLRSGDQRDYVYSKTMHKAANILVRRALKSNCDSICFIDSDAVFGSDALEELRSDRDGWDYDVLQAFTVKRGWPPEPMFLVEQPQQPTHPSSARRGVFFSSQLPIDPSYIYPAKSDNYRIAVSLHFTLIRLDLLRKMIEDDDPETTFFFEYVKDNGEDINFSIKANELGARLGMTSRLRVGHVSEIVSGWDTMIDYYDRKYQLETGAAGATLERYAEHHRAIASLAALVAEFTGEPTQDVYQKAIIGAGPVADAWRNAAPKSEYEIDLFYQRASVYLYDLILWNTSPAFQTMLAALKAKLSKSGELESSRARALDFGGGLGTVTEFLAAQGCEVHYHDLAGVLLDFAAWRFERLPVALSSRILIVERWPLEYYDLVIAIDVIEHLHPQRVAHYLDGLIGALKGGGVLFAHNTFDQLGGAYPQHFDHSREWREALERHGLVEIDRFSWMKPRSASDASEPSEAIDPRWLTEAIQEIAQ